MSLGGVRNAESGTRLGTRFFKLGYLQSDQEARLPPRNRDSSNAMLKVAGQHDRARETRVLSSQAKRAQRRPRLRLLLVVRGAERR